MKHLILHVVCCSIISASAICAEFEPHSNISPELIAKTVCWQTHWDCHGGLTNKHVSTITFKLNERSEVWIDGLGWVISFDERHDQPYPYFFQRAAELPDEMRREVLVSFSKIKGANVKLPVYTNCFTKIDKIGTNIRAKLLAAIEYEACTADMLNFYKNSANRPIEKLRVWVAPVDTNFPVMLYVVEGAPYIGKVYYGTQTLNPLYSEYNYINDDAKMQKSGQMLIAAIRSEGDRYSIVNGRLVASNEPSTGE